MPTGACEAFCLGLVVILIFINGTISVMILSVSLESD